MRLKWKINPKWAISLYLISVGLWLIYIFSGDHARHRRGIGLAFLAIAVLGSLITKEINRIRRKNSAKTKSRVWLYLRRTIKLMAFMVMIFIPILVFVDLLGLTMTQAIEMRLSLVWIASMFVIAVVSWE